MEGEGGGKESYINAEQILCHTVECALPAEDAHLRRPSMKDMMVHLGAWKWDVNFK